MFSMDKDREKARNLVESTNFNRLILFLILFDSVILGLMSSQFLRLNMGLELFLVDRLIVALFISEMMIKIYAYRGKFFQNGWNLMDLTVVIVSIIPATSYFVIIRSLRLLRLVKYVDHNLKITVFVNALISTIPLLATAMVSFGFLVYIYAIISVGLYGEMFVEFSSLGTAMFSLLQMIIFDGASASVIKMVMYISPWSFVFFISYMLIAYLILLTYVVLSIKTVKAK